MDFTEFETTRGGIWRISECADYWAKAELGWHVSMSQNHQHAIKQLDLHPAPERFDHGVIVGADRDRTGDRGGRTASRPQAAGGAHRPRHR